MQSPDASHLVWTGPLGEGIKKLVVFLPFLGPQGPLRVPSSVEALKTTLKVSLNSYLRMMSSIIQ